MKSFNRYLPLLAISFVIAVNAAANIMPINGYATGQLSDLNPTGFTPAGWVFAIWSLIYLGLLAYACVSAFGSEAIRVRAASVRTLFLCNAAVNVAWIFAWHYRQVELSSSASTPHSVCTLAGSPRRRSQISAPSFSRSNSIRSLCRWISGRWSVLSPPSASTPGGASSLATSSTAPSSFGHQWVFSINPRTSLTRSRLLLSPEQRFCRLSWFGSPRESCFLSPEKKR